MGAKRNVTIAGNDQIKIVKKPLVADQQPAPVQLSSEEVGQPVITDSPTASKPAPNPKQRSAKYRAVRAKVDKTRKYPIDQAVELVKKLSYSSFVGSVELALVLKEVGTTGSVQFPHSTGKQIKVAVVTDQILAEIEQGKLDFQVLVASPEWMPKLTKFAKILGPKGLMPNPKNGTLTNNPELKLKELSGGKITLKTEKKAPLINCAVGKLSMPSDQLVENIQAVLKVFFGKVVAASIAPTMGPGVKLTVEK